jgi:hypothetical protein
MLSKQPARSASSTQSPRVGALTATRTASTAWCGERRRRKPNEHSKKSASKMGSSTHRAAAIITRSVTVGIPNGRVLVVVPALGMWTRRNGRGRYQPDRNASASSPRNRSTPEASTSAIETPSTPGAPRFARTRSQPMTSTSLRATLS